jgi:glycosyltransferase involved in cell wall biosynthesis
VLRARDALGEYARDGRWARDAADLATRLARAQRYIACVTCGPPHMAHDAGRRLRIRTGLPHVMDLRDPWSLAQRVPEGIASPVWFALARRHERRAVASAGLVVMNTEPAATAMRGEYPAAAARIIAVPSGFDAEPVPTVPRGRAFVIAYAGSIYLDRDPRLLLRAAARVIREQRLTPDDLRVEFMGNVKSFEGRTLERIAEDEGVGPYVRRHPPASRRLALGFMATASMLVSLYQDSHWAIPGKMFEYMLFDAWVLALALPGSATADLLAGSGADIVGPEDVEAIASVVARRYAEHRAGVRPQRLADNERFSRGTQAAVLFDAIGRLTGALGL